MSLMHRFYGFEAQSTRQNPVVCRWITSSLNMSKYTDAHIVLFKVVANLFRQLHCTSHLIPLCNHDKRTALLMLQNLIQRSFYLINVLQGFGQQNQFSTGRQTGFQSDKSGIPSHYLNNKQAFMGISSITNFIDRFHCGVERGIVSYCLIASHKVVIDRTRNSYYTNLMLFGDQRSTSKGTVASNYNQPIYIVIAHLLCS